MRSTPSLLICAAVMTAVSAVAVYSFGPADFGLFRDNQMEAHSEQLFGVVSGVEA